VSSREWFLQVQDILNAINAIQRHTAGLTLSEFQNHEMALQAVLYNFVIVGEAARNIPAEIQQRYPQILWRDVISTRDIAAHEYFQTELQILWDTIQTDLPALAIQLQDLLERESNDRP
jgi:uncharacterized protein with HEPN domain